MNVKQLQDFIVSSILKGDLSENSNVKFQTYMNSEWGNYWIDTNFAKVVDNVLLLSDEQIEW